MAQKNVLLATVSRKVILAYHLVRCWFFTVRRSS